MPRPDVAAAGIVSFPALGSRQRGPGPQRPHATRVRVRAVYCRQQKEAPREELETDPAGGACCPCGAGLVDRTGLCRQTRRRHCQGSRRHRPRPDRPRRSQGLPGHPRAPKSAWDRPSAGPWVGWIFSTVGAFGGVMAGVGHISVFGYGAYAKSFKSAAPELNKLVTDSIRTSNQWLVGLSALISSFNYWKMGRLVLPLAAALGLGSIAGSWLSVTLTAGKVSFSSLPGLLARSCSCLAATCSGRPPRPVRPARKRPRKQPRL